MMFGSRQTDLSVLDARSKMSLKLSCLNACGNDVSKASALYDFLAEGIDLPDTDPVEPSTVERIRQGADDILGWLGGHRDDIAQGISLVRSLIPSKGAENAVGNVPPIPKI